MYGVIEAIELPSPTTAHLRRRRLDQDPAFRLLLSPISPSLPVPCDSRPVASGAHARQQHHSHLQSFLRSPRTPLVLVSVGSGQRNWALFNGIARTCPNSWRSSLTHCHFLRCFVASPTTWPLLSSSGPLPGSEKTRQEAGIGSLRGIPMPPAKLGALNRAGTHPSHAERPHLSGSRALHCSSNNAGDQLESLA